MTKPTEKPASYRSSTFRLGELAGKLEKRAASESKAAGRKVTPSAVVKRALRAYLDAGDGQQIDAAPIIEALVALRSDLARVGGNLNQLSHSFNIYSQVDERELHKRHVELQAEFGKIMSTMREIQRELYRRR